MDKETVVYPLFEIFGALKELVLLTWMFVSACILGRLLSENPNILKIGEAKWLFWCFVAFVLTSMGFMICGLYCKFKKEI